MTKLRENLHIFAALVGRDLHLMRRMLFDNLLDSSIIVGVSYLLYGKLLPSMGTSPALITPTFFGVIAIILVNLSYDRAMTDAIDFDSHKLIHYQMLTPISSAIFPLKYICSYVLDILISTIPVMILGWIVFGPLLVLERCNILLFALVYILGAAFMSTLLLLVAVARPFQWFAYLTWPFILLPLTTLGSFYYPLKAVEQMMPWFGAIVRWLPTTSLVEGMRGSMINGAQYLPVTECIMRLVVYNIIAYFLLSKMMRKRFDMVEEQ